MTATAVIERQEKEERPNGEMQSKSWRESCQCEYVSYWCWRGNKTNIPTYIKASLSTFRLSYPTLQPHLSSLFSSDQQLSCQVGVCWCCLWTLNNIMAVIQFIVFGCHYLPTKHTYYYQCNDTLMYRCIDLYSYNQTASIGKRQVVLLVWLVSIWNNFSKQKSIVSILRISALYLSWWTLLCGCIYLSYDGKQL